MSAPETDEQPVDVRFERAIGVASRLLANVETAVHGKREEIRLVLAALASGGHVLFEDVPGTAKTVLARAITQSVAGAVGTRVLERDGANCGTIRFAGSAPRLLDFSAARGGRRLPVAKG